MILYNMHIDPWGSFRGSGQPPIVIEGKLQPAFGYLPEVIQTLTAPGSSIQNIFICVGGWGNAGDFVHAGPLGGCNYF